MKFEVRLNEKYIASYIVCLLMTGKNLLPFYFAKMIEDHFILDIGTTFFSIILMGIYILMHTKKLDLKFLTVAVIYVPLIFSTLINGGNMFHVVWHSTEVLLVCKLLETIKDDEKQLIPFLTAIRDFTLLFYIMNFGVMFMMPKGIPSISAGKLWPWFLYGNVNTTIKYILPGICCSLLLDDKNHKKFSLSTLIFLGGIVFSALTVYFTATAVIADTIIILWVMFFFILKKKTWRYFALPFIGGAMFEFLVVFTTSATKFVVFITTLFNKSLTFSGRAPLWVQEYRLFLRQPLFGYGYISFAKLEHIVGNGNGAHNYYLDMMHQRGLFGLGVLLIFFLFPILYNWNKDVSSKRLFIIMGICGAYAVMFLSEPFYTSENTFIPLFYILFLSCFKKQTSAEKMKQRLQKLIPNGLGGQYE